MYTVVYTKAAAKHITLLKSANLDKRAKKPVDLVTENPFQNPPPYEKLLGDMNGLYSRRINIHHRLVYRVYSEEKAVKIISMWSHYEF